MGAVIGNIVYYALPLSIDNIILVKILKIKINIFKHAIKPTLAFIFMSIVMYVTYFVLHHIIILVIGGYMSVVIPTLIAMSAGFTLIL